MDMEGLTEGDLDPVASSTFLRILCFLWFTPHKLSFRTFRGKAEPKHLWSEWSRYK